MKIFLSFYSVHSVTFFHCLLSILNPGSYCSLFSLISLSYKSILWSLVSHWRWIGQTIRKFWLSTSNPCMWSQTMMFSILITYTIHMMSLRDHHQLKSHKKSAIKICYQILRLWAPRSSTCFNTFPKGSELQSSARTQSFFFKCELETFSQRLFDWKNWSFLMHKA